jgi:hypothetical protein
MNPLTAFLILLFGSIQQNTNNETKITISALKEKLKTNKAKLKGFENKLNITQEGLGSSIWVHD